MAGNLRARLARIRERSSETPSGKPANPDRPDVGNTTTREDFPEGWTVIADGLRFRESISGPVVADPGDAVRLAALSARAGGREVAWKGIVFFDLETTGLSGGSGTVAFLAAIGRLREDGSLSVRQYFMDDYPAEPRFLESLEAEFLSAEAVVTYNGSSFDMPLYSVRRVMNGFGPPAATAHADALHAARRLWRRTLGDCSLSSIERAILGVNRVDDIPGAEVPDAWFDYLRRGKTERLARVFYHNELDVRSLAALTAMIHQAACGLIEPPSCYQPGLAELQSRIDEKRAEATLVRAVESGERAAVRPLMRLYRKHDRGAERAALVPLLPDDAAGLFSKSVYAERRMGDVRAAVELAVRAESAAAGMLKERAARRVHRLTLKLEKIQSTSE